LVCGFVHNTLANGRQIRVLTIDDFTREALSVEVDFMLPTQRVLRVFDAIGWERGLLKRFGSTMGRSSQV